VTGVQTCALPIYLLAYEDGTECSETSEYKIQTPGYYPAENIQQRMSMFNSEQTVRVLIVGIGLKSKCCLPYLFFSNTAVFDTTYQLLLSLM
jgi:hypothetical protein